MLYPFPNLCLDYVKVTPILYMHPKQQIYCEHGEFIVLSQMSIWIYVFWFEQITGDNEFAIYGLVSNIPICWLEYETPVP